MRMIWCPETATNAYLNTVKFCSKYSSKDLGAPEFISAMAGGWRANLIVEAPWFNIDGSSGSGTAFANSIGLAIAAHHSGGRHVCIVPNEKARHEYVCAMQRLIQQPTASGVSCSLPEVMVGEAEELMERLNGVDFLVVDGGREDYGRVFGHAKFGHLGAVVIKNNNRRTFHYHGLMKWIKVFQSNVNVVRSTFLPIGSHGIEVAYVAGENSSYRKKSGPKGWIKCIDRQSGEEHVFRR